VQDLIESKFCTTGVSEPSPSITVKKLNSLFKDVVKIISNYPQIGNATDDQKVRIKVVKDYLIVYEEKETQLLILTVWGTQQDPISLIKF
jgi:predicted nucleotide-binding protein (sugar kinase/HSP70/actin superfamily)